MPTIEDVIKTVEALIDGLVKDDNHGGLLSAQSIRRRDETTLMISRWRKQQEREQQEQGENGNQ